MTNDIHPVDKFVGAKVRMARLNENLSQTELAEKLGITFQQVQKYESGKNRISASRLYDIAHIVNSDVAYFFAEYDNGVIKDDASQSGAVNAYDYISTPEMINLIQAFNKIEDINIRKAVVNLVRSMHN